MSKNSANQQPKTEPQWQTISSLILGIISIILPYIIIVWQAGVVSGTLGRLLWYGTGLGGGSAKVFLLGMIVAGICAIFGLIFGTKGLKSTRRKLAIVGITICAISLLFWIWLLLVWLIAGGLIYL
ncbi:MAG: hypothetical protein MUO97_07325 [Dehalococcoidia bacterium]|nr:hypothetical protein [Dehalococcoidia bacterium]